MARPKKVDDTPTEEMPAQKTGMDDVLDHIRWIKIGGAYRGEGDKYPDGLPRWVPESCIVNPKSDSMMTGDDLIREIYKGGWKFGPLLQHSGYGLLIVYREKA
jgi:hypothetical protein